MYFVGIDISKFKHDCAVIDDIGDIVTPSWSFTNDCEGFSLLKQMLDASARIEGIGSPVFNSPLIIMAFICEVICS